MPLTADAALVSLDWVNDIVDPKGQHAARGFADFAARHGTLARVARALALFRDAGAFIVHVRVGFSPGFPELPTTLPSTSLFRGARAAGSLALGTWATEFVSAAAPRGEELVLVKHRASAFHGTALDVVLRARGVTRLFLSGVSTDMAVEATARTAHDLDYAVTILADCCAAASDEDHRNSLRFLAKIAAVVDLAELG